LLTAPNFTKVFNGIVFLIYPWQNNLLIANNA